MSYRHACCVLLLNCLYVISADAGELRTPDVVVYGATPAGVCAAIAAARENATVALVEPLSLVGGMMSSGLSFSDSNQCDRRMLRGLFEEIHRRISADYAARGVKLPYDVEVKDNKHWTYEPHVAEQVFNAMLREAKVSVYLSEQLTTIDKVGNRIAALHSSGGTFRAKQYLDATYEGDLLAAAQVSWVVGREGKSVYGETLAGHQFPKPSIKSSPLNEQGRLLPLLSGMNAGADETDGKIMTYSWRISMTNVPANRVPIARPAKYDPARFELARRLLRSGAKPNTVGLDFYPIPGEKVDINNGIGKQISMGLPGENWKWPTATPAERALIWQQHKDYAIEFLWFLQTDPSVSEQVRQMIREYGLSKDEFTRFDHWPPVLYIREGRRMRGEYVLTQRDVRNTISKPDSIGISSFPVDSHDCQRVADGQGGWVNEGTIFPVHMTGTKYGQPYQVPYRSITPQRAECTNLLVPVCLSASHVAFSSVRVEPTWMMLGQSAGVAAALSARANVAVQELPIAELQARLRQRGQVLDLLPEHLAKRRE